MRYYLEESRLAVAREDERHLMYRWDWIAEDWVYDVELVGKVKLGNGWWDEVPESEAMDAIENRTVPVVGT